MFRVPVAALALHQRSAPIDARERLLELVMPWGDRSTRVVVATCHRVEIYLAAADSDRADELASDLDARGGAVFRASLVHLSGTDAVAHLFEVVMGLDSAVQGEPQIRGQVRAVLAAAPPSLDPTLRRLLERALSLRRSLRQRSALVGVSQSVGSLAVDEVVRVVPNAQQATVLVIGAGEMGALAVRALVRRVARVIVANRDRTRAEALARSAGAEAIGLADVAERLGEVGAVVSAADTRGAVLDEAILGARLARGPIAVVDIAVPRSVGPAARALDGLTYRSVDDLAGARTLSADDTARLRTACAAEGDRFARECAERAAARAITEVRAHAHATRLRQLDRALRRLGNLSARDRRVVETLSARVVNSLLHEPTLALKKQPDRSEHALALFGIDEQR